MTRQRFSVAQANELVPRLEGIFQRVVRLRGQLQVVSEELEELGEPLTDKSLRRRGGQPPLLSARGRAAALVEALSDDLRVVEALGVEVKDLDRGLCDFPSVREGRLVYLCWQLGEKRVAFWHELHTGFAGRTPLDEKVAPIVH